MKAINKEQKINELGNWVFWILIIVIVSIVAFSFFSEEEDSYEKDCVDRCVSKIGDCAGLSYVVGSDGETWLYGWDFESCFSELEGCVDRCEE